MIYLRDEIEGFSQLELLTFAFLCGVGISTEIVIHSGVEWVYFEIYSRTQSRIDCFLEKIGRHV